MDISEPEEEAVLVSPQRWGGEGKRVGSDRKQLVSLSVWKKAKHPLKQKDIQILFIARRLTLWQ